MRAARPSVAPALWLWRASALAYDMFLAAFMSAGLACCARTRNHAACGRRLIAALVFTFDHFGFTLQPRA